MIENLEEFRHRYCNSIISYEKDGERVPVRIEEVDFDNNSIGLYDYAADDFITVAASEADFIYEYPTAGMVNSSRGSVYVTRYGSNNAYKRGIHRANSELAAVSLVTGRTESTASRSFLKALFNNYMFSFEEAMTSVCTGKRRAAAFSETYAFVKRSHNVPILLHGTKIVGYVQDGHVYIHPDLDFVEMELRELSNNAVSIRYATKSS